MKKALAYVGLGMTVLLCGVSVALTAYAWKTGARLYQNVGVSLPPGFYLCLPVPAEGLLPLGAIVEIAPPTFAVEGIVEALSAGVSQMRWLKQVAVWPEDTVCMAGDEVQVNGQVVAHRPLAPRYPIRVVDGCWAVTDDEVFVMGTHPRSWDSRYFGPLPRSAVKGICEAVWTWEAK